MEAVEREQVAPFVFLATSSRVLARKLWSPSADPSCTVNTLNESACLMGYLLKKVTQVMCIE